MNRRLIRKIFKIIGWTLFGVFVIATYLIYDFTSPSSEAEIMEKFEDDKRKPFISYSFFKGHKVRVVSMQEEMDSILPTIFFVHGSPGSSMDFKRYLKDSTLNSLANIISYDRIGYGPERTGEVVNTLQEEVDLLHQLLDGMDMSKVVLVGYSYGGTVVMASDLNYKKKIALAASVKGDLEPMFWAMNLYSWQFTRPLIPKVFRGASIEKFRHVTELSQYSERWGLSKSQVLSIHGKEDFIVPFENSIYLQNLLGKTKFTLIPLEEGNQSLIWTNFELIKTELIKSLSKNEF
jgi:pimeloyl-ACP methyl ester carboxylesterase